MREQIYDQNEIIRFEINNSDWLKYINKIHAIWEETNLGRATVDS